MEEILKREIEDLKSMLIDSGIKSEHYNNEAIQDSIDSRIERLKKIHIDRLFNEWYDNIEI